jgi:hypothetical protein
MGLETCYQKFSNLLDHRRVSFGKINNLHLLFIPGHYPILNYIPESFFAENLWGSCFPGYFDNH